MILYPRPEPSSIDPSKTRHRFAIESSSNSSNSSNNDWALDSPFYAFTHTPKTTSRAGRVLILLFANPRCPWPCNYLSNVPPPRSLILPPSSLQHLLGDRPATGQPAPSEVQRRNDIRQIGNKSYRKKVALFATMTLKSCCFKCSRLVKVILPENSSLTARLAGTSNPPCNNSFSIPLCPHLLYAGMGECVVQVSCPQI